MKSKFRLDCTSCKFVVSSSSKHQHFRSSHTCQHLLCHENPSAHFPENDPNCSFPPTYLPETSVFLVCVCVREMLLLHLIPDLLQNVSVVLVNKKSDHKEKEKHRC